jgi:hypothetical protein
MVLGVAVQSENTDLDQRKIFVRSDFGQVERVKRRFVGVGLGDDLDAKAPFCVVSALDRFALDGMSGANPIEGFNRGDAQDAIRWRARR